LIRVINPQDEATALAARIKPIEQRGAHSANM
jgi:hypothetical protein